MEKKGNPKPINQILPQERGADKQEMHQNDRVSKLGGIHLYNEDFKRHLCVKSTNPNQKFKKTGNNSSDNYKSDQQESIIEHEIKDFLQNRQQHKLNINSVFTSQIQNIIQSFKTSHYTTNRFLEEHQNKNEHIDNLSVFSFDELFDLEKSKNKVKYSRLMEKLVDQFRDLVVKEIRKMKVEEINKAKEKESQIKEFGTQTPHDHDHDAALLKKQLERKEAEFNALYEYKKDMINEGANMVKNYEIKCQFQQSLIGKLENEIASKNLEVRGLQNTLKTTQDRLFNRIVQLQKLYASSQARESLSSIKQMNPFDLLKENDILSNFLTKLNSKKKRFKQRAESVLSVTQSLFSNLKDKDDIIASMADLAAKSMREIDVHFDNEVDDHYIDELQRLSKHSLQAQNLFKILEVYKKTKKNRVSIEKISKKAKNKINNLKKNPQRNSSLLGLKIEKQSSDRNSFRQESFIQSRVKSKDRRDTNEESKPTKKLSKNLETTKEQIRPKLSITRKQSIDRKLDAPLHIPMPSAFKEKPSNFKVSIKEIPISNISNDKMDEGKEGAPCQINQSRKKLKKGVSFQFEHPKLQLHSLEVSICIVSSSPAKKSTCENIYTSPSINEKTGEPNIQSFDKHRFSKNKLIKTRLKEQIHKKVGSYEFESNTPSTAWSTTNHEKTLFHNATASNFYRAPYNSQKERFSCHTSQDKINPFDNSEVRPKPRNSFSRLQRSTVMAGEDKQMRMVKQMAAKCRDKGEYLEKVRKLHRGCAQNCEHIRRFLQYYDRCRQGNRKENLKLNVENLNNNLRPLPTLKNEK